MKEDVVKGAGNAATEPNPMANVKVIAPPADFTVGATHTGLVDGEFASSMTNEEVEDLFEQMLKSGHPVVIARKPAINGFVDVYLAQSRDIARAKRLNGTGGPRGLTMAEIAFKDFGGPIIIRHRDVFAEDAIESWVPGCQLQGLTLGIYDATEASDDRHEENPRQSREGFVYVTSEEDPIFRHTSLDFTELYEGDFVLDYKVTKMSIERYKAKLEAQRAAAEEVEA